MCEPPLYMAAWAVEREPMCNTSRYWHLYWLGGGLNLPRNRHKSYPKWTCNGLGKMKALNTKQSFLGTMQPQNQPKVMVSGRNFPFILFRYLGIRINDRLFDTSVGCLILKDSLAFSGLLLACIPSPFCVFVVPRCSNRFSSIGGLATGVFWCVCV